MASMTLATLAEDLLLEAGMESQADLRRYVPQLVERIQDDVDSIMHDWSEAEYERDEAAREAHWQHKLDVLRGK